VNEGRLCNRSSSYMLCFSLDRKSTRYAHNKVIDVNIVQDLPCCGILVSSASLCNRRLLLSSYLEEEVDSDLVSHHYIVIALLWHFVRL